MDKLVHLSEVITFVQQHKGPGTLVHDLRRHFAPVLPFSKPDLEAALSVEPHQLSVDQVWRLRVKGGVHESKVRIRRLETTSVPSKGPKAQELNVCIANEYGQPDIRWREFATLEFLELIK